ncbi:CpsB/CapC family capsule biosynthesis tyrosine phosphatase [Wukongibacter baidiensis]|uniref:tyrosine-protein phosphatase n=1 Tax=Wukongibacter baidiensis TaxID=1723361 RepID=UPI003D7F9579
MIDIHCHILPFMDDGPRSVNEALEMAKVAYEDGIRKIVATPHYIENGMVTSRDKVMKSIQEFNYILQENSVDIEILPGHEVYFTWKIPLYVKKEEVCTLNNTQYFLMEFPLSNMPKQANEIIFRLKLMGKTPILAHPERYKEVQENPNILIEYINMGVLCQVTSGSITGRFGKKAMETVRTLIKNNMAHFVASDGHSSRVRAPRLKSTYRKSIEVFGEEKAEKLFKINPQKVIKGEEINIEEPIMLNKKNIVESFSYIFRVNNKRAE